jgi:hypothetical protein
MSEQAHLIANDPTLRPPGENSTVVEMSVLPPKW